MKSKEKNQAKALRSRGYSMNEICRELGVSKSSVSLWVRDVNLTDKQKEALSNKGQRIEVIERRRVTRLSRENKRRQIIIDKAQREVKKVPKRGLFFIGISLYWAEGSKTKRGVVEFSNSDPRLIKIMMRFFQEICLVPAYKFRGHVYLHPHLNTRKAETYWRNVSGIPKKQFYKTTQQHNKASKGKKDSLPFGTFSVSICSTELFLKITGWTQGMYKELKEGK